MSPRRQAPRESEPIRQAREAGLSERCIRLSAALRGRHGVDAGKVEQPEQDLIRAYTRARGLAGQFEDRLRAARWPGVAEAKARPTGVKRLERMVEKYLYSKKALVVPMDMLAAKVVVGSLWEMYDVASHVQAVFPVVGYRDRIVRPQASGYRDLQFVVDVDGHYAELKVMHQLIDELDGFEHQLYEIRRALQAREVELQQTAPSGTGFGDAPFGTSPFGAPILTPIEQMVLDTLEGTSADLFDKTWKMILAAEDDSS